MVSVRFETQHRLLMSCLKIKQISNDSPPNPTMFPRNLACQTAKVLDRCIAESFQVSTRGRRGLQNMMNKSDRIVVLLQFLKSMWINLYIFVVQVFLQTALFPWYALKLAHSRLQCLLCISNHRQPAFVNRRPTKVSLFGWFQAFKNVHLGSVNFQRGRPFVKKPGVAS